MSGLMLYVSDILPGPMMGPEINAGLGAVPIPLCCGGAGSGFWGNFAISSCSYVN